MTATDIISVMTQRLVEEFQPLKIILFGSRARGDARPDSDVDLLVVLSECEDKRKTAVAMRRVLTGFPVGKDIIVTTPEEIARRGNVTGTVLRPALREGKTLYDRA